MNNRDIQAAWKYHDDTKHSYRSLRDHPHFLDWANRPLPFKIYPQIEPAVTHAPATIVCTGTYWRNAWKYQARTYRHFGWDNGTLLANMLAVSTASGLPAEIVLGFVDTEVNRLLDLDTRREVSLSF